jgi:hypothetical protein
MSQQILAGQQARLRPGRRAKLVELLALPALVGLIVLLAFVNLPYAPPTWFDEGSHLHVPKTLVRHGVYADISSEGFRYYGPTIGVGPTVMLPVAGVFALFGVDLLYGRLVIVAYLLLALLALYLLARALHGRALALLALALALASRTRGYEGMVEYGRQVLGEVPGIAFLLLGALLWVGAVQQPARTRALSLGAGLCFGLALVTKNQFVLIVPPTLALLALLDWAYYRAGSWWLRLAPLPLACACFGLWTLAQLGLLGPGGFMTNLTQMRQAAAGAIFVFDLDATLRAARYLAQVYGGLLIPALAYGLWRCRLRTAQALCELLAVLLPLLWISWFLISLGWPRYAFPAVIFGALAVARLIGDAYGWLWARARLRAVAWLLAAYSAAVLVLPLALTLRVVFSPDDSAQRFAAYLDAQVVQGLLVETWEPELGLLTDHLYHYPPIELLDRAVRSTWLGEAPPRYDGLDARPAYVAVGPFGAWVRIYDPAVLASDYVVEFAAGPYTLYRRQ